MAIVKPVYADKKSNHIEEWSAPKISEKSLAEKKKKEASAKEKIEQEIAELKESAYQEGFKQGEAAGLTTGKETIEKTIERLQCLEQELIKPLNQLTGDILLLLQKIIVNVVQAIILHEIKTDPLLIESILRDIITTLNEPSHKIHLQCAKHDAEIIRNYFPTHFDNKVDIEESDVISPGGFIVATEHAYGDATIETRIKQIIDQHFLQEDR